MASNEGPSATQSATVWKRPVHRSRPNGSDLGAMGGRGLPQIRGNPAHASGRPRSLWPGQEGNAAVGVGFDQVIGHLLRAGFIFEDHVRDRQGSWWGTVQQDEGEASLIKPGNLLIGEGMMKTIKPSVLCSPSGRSLRIELLGGGWSGSTGQSLSRSSPLRCPATWGERNYPSQSQAKAGDGIGLVDRQALGGSAWHEV